MGQGSTNHQTMRTIAFLLIALLVYSSIASAVDGPSSSTRKDLGILETPWGKKRCFDAYGPKTAAVPEYPLKQKKAGIGSRVSAAVHVNEKGKVVAVAIMTSGADKAFDDAAIKALKKWTFEPFVEDGVAKEFVTLQRMEFRPQ